MRSVFDRIRKLFTTSDAQSLSLEELQTLFTRKYELFRELLTANNNSLEAMAAMEQAYREGRTYSMAFIRTNSTVVSVNVYKMIQCLTSMAEGRYSRLNEAFDTIRRQLDKIIDHEIVEIRGEWFYPLNEVNTDLVDLTGEKMANLGEAASLPGIRIPPGFVVSSSATRHFFLANNLYEEINRIFQQTDARNMEDLHKRSNEVQSIIKRAPLPADLEEQLYNQFDRLIAGRPSGVKLAVRSSALGEDTRRASFAGLYQTELMVDREDLIPSYKAVIASTYSSRAMTYRLERGFLHEDTVMCVGCLIMIDAVVSGVCYSQSITGRPFVMDIFFSEGSAGKIVNGTKDTDHLLVEKKAPYHVVGLKGKDLQAKPLLSEHMVREIGETVQRLENHFGSPQDIEWSFDGEGRLYILQSRPISIIPKLREDDTLPPVEDSSILLRGGVTGNPGAACGPVFIVRSSVDLLSFPEKSVLVVEHPLPEWAPLLRKAVALVAQTGSEAGHLATIAREYDLPALLSVQEAVGKTVNGQTVTVDATGRTIYLGCVEELLQKIEPGKNPMMGSPVQQTMIEVLKLIAPLNLTDPFSPWFRSSRCRTMHDITRFCHEKSVIEMFDFGKRYTFDRGAAKRLVDNMPLEWWVINLADGFAEGFDSTERYINISEITSIPMLAIWEGMHAARWDGPPGGSLRGMGSILFQSTRLPGIDPAVPSAMAQKNYFLISKTYCNLSVRLGYHYAMIEAFIGNLRTERYVTFRFKGGAADEKRRAVRVKLLYEVLEHFHFRVESAQDALTARVEKRSQQFLLERLKVLGYLTIHTRQIDLVMAAPEQYRYYREKFLREIKEMLTDEE